MMTARESEKISPNPGGMSETRDRVLEVSESDFEEFLCLYNREGRLISRAVYDAAGMAIDAVMRHYPLDFYVRPLSHLSRVQIVHYLGQVGFVLGGCLARSGAFPGMGQSDYVRALREERVTFGRLSLQFREFLPNAGGVQVRLEATGIRETKFGWVVRLAIDINGGACRGSADGLILAPGMRDAPQTL